MLDYLSLIITNFSFAILVIAFVKADQNVKYEESKDEPIAKVVSKITELTLKKICSESQDQWNLYLNQIKSKHVKQIIDQG